MKSIAPVSLIFAAIGAMMLPAKADLFVTNFTALNAPAGATGVWRNESSSIDLEIPVSLGQVGGEVRPEDGSSSESRYSLRSFLYFDNPLTMTNYFEPNFEGDYISIQVVPPGPGGITVSVTIEFNATVTDPVLYFSDVDTQTTLVFNDDFSISGQSGNMLKSGTTVTTNGTPVPFFDQETFGSLQFSGTFTKLNFSIVNAGSDPINDIDRTGFCVATESAPVPLTTSSPPMLGVSVNGDQVTVDWGEAGAIDMLEMLNEFNAWVEVTGSNPAESSSYVGSKMELGSSAIFRAIYGGP